MKSVAVIMAGWASLATAAMWDRPVTTWYKAVTTGVPEPYTPQPLEQYPQCAIDCLKKAMDENACAYTDVKCGCDHRREMVKIAKPCVIKSCSIGEAMKAQERAKKACQELDSRY